MRVACCYLLLYDCGLRRDWSVLDVLPRRLAPVQHRHLPARGLLSLPSLLRGAFLLTAIKRNQAQSGDGTSRLDCASHLDVMSLAANIFAPFGAVPRISRTAGRMAHDLLCAALLLLGCLRPARAARLAIAALGIYAALRTSACCSTPPPRSHQRPHGPV